MKCQTEGLLSPFLREKRIKMALPFIKGYILDYGCGIGRLAGYIDSNRYLGVDINKETIELATVNYPEHNFILIKNEDLSIIKSIRNSYDTIVALAVIEHIKEPGFILEELSLHLSPEGKIVLTTPHPMGRIIHDFGSMIGLFSRAAAKEHEKLLGKGELKEIFSDKGLDIVLYRRFLFFFNQLLVLKKRAVIKQRD